MGDSIDFQLMAEVALVLFISGFLKRTYRINQSDRFIGIGGCCDADELDHIYCQTNVVGRDLPQALYIDSSLSSAIYSPFCSLTCN